MTTFLQRLKGRRVLPRWKLGLLVLIGVLAGFLIALVDYGLAIFSRSADGLGGHAARIRLMPDRHSSSFKPAGLTAA